MADLRQAIAEEALTWIGTPYRNVGRIKGVGTNCAQFIYAVALAAGAIPADAPEPRWYTPQLATNSKEERLASYVLSYGAREIAQAEAATGDVVLFKSGLSHGHAALILDWPTIIHVLPPSGCQKGDAFEGQLGQFAKRYFTLFAPERA